MRTNISIKYSLLITIGMLFSLSCTKDFKDINTNPVAYGPGTFDPNYTLTTAQLSYTGSIDFAYDTWRGNLIYSATMMQGLSTVVSYWAGDKYLLNPGYTAAYWGTGAVGAYIEQVRPIVDVVEYTKSDPKYNNIHQVARLWKALIFERITDLYGDVPYSEAGLGVYTGNLTPKYDKQQDIYTNLLKEVDEATNALNEAGGDKVTGDAIYNGNIGNWKRFGSSLLLRIAMRLTKIDEAKAKEYAQKAIGKTMIDNKDNAFLNHDVGGARVTQNRNSQVLRGDGGQEHYYTKWSKTFIDILKSNNDPRLGKVAVTQLYLSDGDKAQNNNYVTTPGAQKGMPNGKDLSGIAGRDVRQDPTFTTFPDYSSLNPAMIKQNGATFILTYAETEFLLAEAAQRWNIGGTAAEHYKAGLKSAITYLSQYDASLEIIDGVAEAFANANPYNAATGLQMINTQYWLHTCTMLDFYETWCNWRRSGFPVLVPVVYPGNATNGTIPRRFPYPLQEGAENGANYRAASAAVPGGDNLSGRVWWDKP
jgi:hypothetical protein